MESFLVKLGQNLVRSDVSFLVRKGNQHVNSLLLPIFCTESDFYLEKLQ